MKITKKKIIVSSLIICSVLLLCLWHVKYARFTHEKMVKYVEKHVVKVLDRMHTTPEQKQQIFQITDQMKIEAVEFRKQIKIRHITVFDDLMSDKVDSVKLHADMDKSLAQLGQFSHMTLDHLIKVGRIFSPEQRAELKKRYESAHGSNQNH